MTGLKRILVYADREDELESLTARLDADGHSTTGTAVDVLAVDLAASADFEAFVIDGLVPPSDQLKLTTEISRRSPGILVIRANGPDAVLTQLRQALTEQHSREHQQAPGFDSLGA